MGFDVGFFISKDIKISLILGILWQIQLKHLSIKHKRYNAGTHFFYIQEHFCELQSLPTNNKQTKTTKKHNKDNKRQKGKDQQESLILWCQGSFALLGCRGSFQTVGGGVTQKCNTFNFPPKLIS